MLSLALILAAACAPDVSITRQTVDADSDGYAVEVDCDDAHATVNPDAPELCDGLDNNCDGETDIDPTDGEAWFADADGDGAGDDETVEVACGAPAGFVGSGGDCDDLEARAYPGNPEVCDTIDNDCNGVVDDDPADLGTFYADDDEDGYGDAALAVTGCESPPGYVADDADCDDLNEQIHPGAPEPDCTDPTDYDCDGSVAYADVDGDGSPACEDCDDTDATRAPFVAEVCDALDVDEDCDGAADDADDLASGKSLWNRDRDADGYGDAASAGVEACESPTGYVADATDCDDYDALANPGEAEVCDALDVDEDCDGLTDDADPSVSAATWSTRYRDGDGDAHGDAARPVSQCEELSGYVVSADDCDDADAAISPDSTELCDGSTDEDCDGLVDDDDAPVSGQTTFYADADGDSYGTSTSSTAACVQPAGYVATTDDCDDTDAAVSPADAEVCGNAVDDDCDGAVDEDCVIDAEAYDAKIYGAATNDLFGISVSGGFDYDNDGIEDLVVGAQGNDDGGTDYGALFVFRGDVSAGARLADDVMYFELAGSATFPDVGAEVVGMEDLDGDGDDELMTVSNPTSAYTNLVLSPWATNGGIAGADYDDYDCDEVAAAGDSNATGGSDDWLCGQTAYSSYTGRIYVYTGYSTLAGTMVGESSSDYAGMAVSGGHDADGDGYDDYVIGGCGDDDTASNAGAAYVVHAPLSASGTFSLSGADVKLRGAAANDYFGHNVLSPGDMNSDGYADVLVGAEKEDSGATDAGAVYLFTNSSASSLTTSDAAARIVSDEGTDVLGSGTAATLSVGDANGDGETDILVGSPYHLSTGQAWLIYGPLSGTFNVSDTGGYDLSFRGSEASDYFGYSGTLASDLDDDGFDDVVIGAPYADEGGYIDYGAVYVFYGG